MMPPSIMKWRVLYGILCLLALWAFLSPWTKIDGTTYTGLSFVVPFSLTYLIGLVLAFVVLFTAYRAVGLTITAGILMLLGVVGGVLGAGIAGGLAQVAGKTGAHVATGLVSALLISIIYTIAGAIIGNRFKKAHMVIETK